MYWKGKTNIHGRRGFTDFLKNKYLRFKSPFPMFYQLLVWPRKICDHAKLGWLSINGVSRGHKDMGKVKLSLPNDISKHTHRFVFFYQWGKVKQHTWGLQQGREHMSESDFLTEYYFTIGATCVCVWSLQTHSASVKSPSNIQSSLSYSSLRSLK